MAGFEGDRGKDRLGGNNVRELVPFFIEQDGKQVVNEQLKLQSKDGTKEGKGKKKAGNKASVDNQAAAAANKATAVRPFAAVQKAATKTVVSNSSAAKHGKWAGGAFLNSPPPSSLPMPKIHGAPLMDPAIVASSQTGGAPFSSGLRVVAMFLDGEWYEGTITEVLAGKCMIIFDGYEDEGGYEIDNASIRPPATQQLPPQAMHPQPMVPPHHPQQLPPHAHPTHYSPVLAPGQDPNLPPGWPLPASAQPDALPTTGGSTSLADLERQLLSSASLQDAPAQPHPPPPHPVQAPAAFLPSALPPPGHGGHSGALLPPMLQNMAPVGGEASPGGQQSFDPKAQLLDPKALLAPQAMQQPPPPQPSIQALPARKPRSSLLASAIGT